MDFETGGIVDVAYCQNQVSNLRIGFDSSCTVIWFLVWKQPPTSHLTEKRPSCESYHPRK